MENLSGIIVRYATFRKPIRAAATLYKKQKILILNEALSLTEEDVPDLLDKIFWEDRKMVYIFA